MNRRDILYGTLALLASPALAQLVGADHVGLGLDYVFDTSEMEDHVRAHPELFPVSEGYRDKLNMVAPEQLREIARGLFARGHRLTDVRKIIGGNFARIARMTWPAGKPR